jgi:predicted transcriptional regulator
MSVQQIKEAIQQLTFEERADIASCLRALQDQETWRAEASRMIDEGWEEAKAGQLSAPEAVRQSLAVRKQTWKQAPVHEGLPPYAKSGGRPFHDLELHRAGQPGRSRPAGN